MLRISYSIEFRALEKNTLASQTLREERVPLRAPLLLGGTERDIMAYKKGDYKYHKSKEAKDARAKRNKNRRIAMREGRVKPGDGKHIDHKDGNPKNNSRKNLRVVSGKANRQKQEKPLKQKKPLKRVT